MTKLHSSESDMPPQNPNPFIMGPDRYSFSKGLYSSVLYMKVKHMEFIIFAFYKLLQIFNLPKYMHINKKYMPIVLYLLYSIYSEGKGSSVE